MRFVRCHLCSVSCCVPSQHAKEQSKCNPRLNKRKRKAERSTERRQLV